MPPDAITLKNIYRLKKLKRILKRYETNFHVKKLCLGGMSSGTLKKGLLLTIFTKKIEICRGGC